MLGGNALAVQPKNVVGATVQRRPDTNTLQINITKRKELVFRRPSARHFSASKPLPFIEQLQNFWEFIFMKPFLYCCTYRVRSVSY